MVDTGPGVKSVQKGDHVITYRELHRKSLIVAEHLLEKGLQKEDLVPVYCERSIEMLIGILGILRAGGVYVPIATELPLQRVDYMLDQCEASCLLTTAATFADKANVLNAPAVKNRLQYAADQPHVMIRRRPR